MSFFVFLGSFSFGKIDREGEMEDGLDVNNIFILTEEQTSVNYEHHRKVIFDVTRHRAD